LYKEGETTGYFHLIKAFKDIFVFKKIENVKTLVAMTWFLHFTYKETGYEKNSFV
jgi:hypothetical protein